MPFEKRIDRESPGCILFLIDQSWSMADDMGGSPGSKADNVAGVVNSVLYELVLRCIKNPEEGPRHYYDVGVIGYGGTVQRELFSVNTQSILVGSDELGQNPLAIREVINSDGTQAKRPIWVEAQASGSTPMCGALDLAGATIAEWISRHPSSFPPIVINVGDGESTDGDPTPWAQRLQGLSTSDGSVMFFNVNISESAGESICFPESARNLPDDLARLLFSISSPLPDYMLSIASASGFPVQPGARGFAFNADFAAVASFLRVGTSTAQMER